MKTKLKTKIIGKIISGAPEYLILNPPHTVFLTPSLRKSQSITMKVGGLRQMLKGLKAEDSFQIEWFASCRATEYSFIKRK